MSRRTDHTPRIAALLLAAGEARRMGDRAGHKLLAEFGGVPLVARVARVALASTVSELVVVTGHRADAIAAALRGLALRLVWNPDFARGMGGSIAAGMQALAPTAPDAVMILLADMPAITTADLDRLIAVFCAKGGVVRASAGGVPGHPVIVPRARFGVLESLRGDQGAKARLGPTHRVELGRAALADVDTPEAVQAAGGVLKA